MMRAAAAALGPTRLWIAHRGAWARAHRRGDVRATASAQELPDDGGPSHLVTDRRLQAFLEAEVTHFAAKPRKALTLEELLRATASPHSLAQCIHQEIPKHFAARMRQITEVPGWEEDEHLAELHRRYSESFSEMRMIEVGQDLAEFTDVVWGLKERQHKAVLLIGHLRDGRCKSIGEDEREFWERWMVSFLRSRTSIEMLTSHYLAITDQMARGTGTATGIVDPACDPAVICEGAAQIAKALCLSRVGVEPEVHIEVRSRLATAFSYVPRYLHYMLVELLKSRCEATAQAALVSSIAEPIPAKPIHVVICSDNHRVAIRIRDLSGGVPFDLQPRVWDFLCPGYSMDHLYDVNIHTMPDSGYGLGLPQVKLVAEYLGGKVTLRSLPDYGDDLHLFFAQD